MQWRHCGSKKLVVCGCDGQFVRFPQKDRKVVDLDPIVLRDCMGKFSSASALTGICTLRSEPGRKRIELAPDFEELQLRLNCADRDQNATPRKDLKHSLTRKPLDSFPNWRATDPCEIHQLLLRDQTPRRNRA